MSEKSAYMNDYVRKAMARGVDASTALIEFEKEWELRGKQQILLPQEGRSMGEFAIELGLFFSDKNLLFYRRRKAGGQIGEADSRSESERSACLPRNKEY